MVTDFLGPPRQQIWNGRKVVRHPDPPFYGALGQNVHVIGFQQAAALPLRKMLDVEARVALANSVGDVCWDVGIKQQLHRPAGSFALCRPVRPAGAFTLASAASALCSDARFS